MTKTGTFLIWAFQHCGVSPDIKTCAFADWKFLPKQQGLYSIWQDNVCIYVGQGGGHTGIRGRFPHHHNKAYAIQQSGTSHGRAWVEARTGLAWQPETWTVEYFLEPSAVRRTFLEGAMMLELDPLCNDENSEDRKSIAK